MSEGIVALPMQPYIGYRFLDYEVYRVDATHIWVVSWVDSQIRQFKYRVTQQGE